MNHLSTYSDLFCWKHHITSYCHQQYHQYQTHCRYLTTLSSLWRTIYTTFLLFHMLMRLSLCTLKFYALFSWRFFLRKGLNLSLKVILSSFSVSNIISKILSYIRHIFSSTFNKWCNFRFFSDREIWTIHRCFPILIEFNIPDFFTTSRSFLKSCINNLDRFLHLINSEKLV